MIPVAGALLVPRLRACGATLGMTYSADRQPTGMITELLGWFAGKDANKRKYPRKKKPFRATYVLADGQTQRPAIGLDISAGGVGFLSQEQIALKEFDMLLAVEERVIRVRTKVCREEPAQYQGKRVFRYGMMFSGIGADDWDLIVRYTTDKPTAEPNKAVQDLQRVRMTPDDTARLLPLALQNRLLAMLVQRGRLAPLDGKTTPLVQYFYSGITRYEGRPMHRLVIQSKMINPDGTSALYETQFVFDDTGSTIGILDSSAVGPQAAQGT